MIPMSPRSVRLALFAAAASPQSSKRALHVRSFEFYTITLACCLLHTGSYVPTRGGGSVPLLPLAAPPLLILV